MKNGRWIGLSLIISSFFGASAFASKSFSLLALGDMSMPSISTGTVSSGTTIGFGGELSFGKKDKYAGVIGLFYNTKSYTQAQTLASFAVSETRLLVPLTIRWIRSVFALDVGPYLSFGMKNMSVTTTIAGVSATTSQNYTDSGLSSFDYGLTLGAGVRLPKGKKKALFAQVRYQLGLANASSNSATTYTYSDLMVVAGLNIEFGKN